MTLHNTINNIYDEFQKIIPLIRSKIKRYSLDDDINIVNLYYTCAFKYKSNDYQYYDLTTIINKSRCLFDVFKSVENELEKEIKSVSITLQIAYNKVNIKNIPIDIFDEAMMFLFDIYKFDRDYGNNGYIIDFNMTKFNKKLQLTK